MPGIKTTCPQYFGINEFTVAWVYDYKWNPDRKANR